MDDSQISVLPADLMAEAHLLRGELEDRSRRMHNQLFSGNISLGSMLRQSGLSGMTPSRYMRRGVGGSSGFSNIWSTNSGAGRDTSSKNVIRRGRQLLDQEGLTCLLVLLFLDEPRLNVSRLHRILKNLSFHNDTLLWIIRALISILFKTNSSKEAHAESSQVSSKQASQSAWLSFGMDAALGCRANVFQVQHSTTKRSAAGTSFGGSVNIHPQAAQLVCQHVMDALIYLSKVFTSHFLPPHVALPADSGLNKDKENSPLGKSKSPKHQSSTSPSVQSFWEVLIRLDQMRLTRKGKGVQRVSTSVSTSASLPPSSADEPATSTSIEESPLGQLMNLLSSSVIRRSPTLTDRLLKLLSSISTAIFPEGSKPPSSRYVGSTWWDSVEGSKIKPQAIVDKSTVLLPNQLRLAVEVLTSKSCSEEGLEDSTRLLVRLSNANQVTKQNIVQLLLSGAQQIGYTVCKHIESLLNEVVEYNRQQALAGGAEPPSGSDFPSAPDLNSLDSDQKPSTSAAAASSASSSRGLIPSRFQEGVMVTIAPPKTKTRTHELQLPSMSLLTTKSSSQQFLLRLLKVIIQLSDKKTPASTPSQGAAAASNQSSGLESAGGQEGADVAAAAGSSADDGASIPSTSQSTTMDMDTSPPNSDPPLCDRLALDKLWDTLGLCLTELANNNDQNAILILQPAVETFFLVHAGQKEATTAKSRRDQQAREDQLSHLNLDEPPPSPATSTTGPIGTTRSDDNLSPETKKFLGFAETHKTVLNQILRQSQTPLSDGPFSVLVDHMKLLDFDVKNRYFKAELQKLDEGIRREDLAVHVRRDHVFEDSYRELFRRTADEWKHRLYIVFEGEEGQDAGGLLREWYMIMSREIFNPNYALFMLTPQDRVTYTINQLSYYNSEHLSYFKFVGRVIAKAIYDNKLLECYFTRSFYKHITGQPVRYTDMEAEDYSFYQGLEFLLNHDIKQLGYDLTFSTEIQELGVTQTRELKPNGTNIVVTEENKKEYVKLVCQLKMTGAIRKQLNAFLEGFYDVIPKYLISIFNEQELELLISGLPTVDIDDLKANAEYHKYTATSLQIVWFWRALRSFDQGERAKFLQFVTGTSKVPLQGFAYLEGMNGTQKFQIHRDDRSTDRLPCAHTCFNQLDLPAYETYDKLKKMLLLVINECSEGFGLA
ncbi:HUWE1 [Bugula neritina]|uniref:HECT-type E3 ubiquitin transferase n=1 Tax=Bugula neritina TaxID=10212 RepID=A0A7J7KQX3_BUGNE|nr:HUWE1 [Bugula neritina]